MVLILFEPKYQTEHNYNVAGHHHQYKGKSGRQVNQGRRKQIVSGQAMTSDWLECFLWPYVSIIYCIPKLLSSIEAVDGFRPK